ncbi:MAG: sensor histidine kinase [Deltaproteobacteria bacterium]|nr:MAG: sensor histidine kinase [Deltaproteobacteria bacterium]
MRLRTRFVLLIALAALGPVGLVGFVANHVSSRLVRAKVDEVQTRTVQALARFTDSWVDLQLRLLARQVVTFPLGELSDEERVGLLKLVYSQTPGAHIVSLVDEQGVDLSPSVYRQPQGVELPAGDRDVVTPERFAEFRRHFDGDRLATPPGRVSFGTPYTPPGRDLPVAVVVARLAGGAALGMELDLAPLDERFRVPEGTAERLVLVDQDGQPICGDPRYLVPEVLRALPAGVLADEITYTTPDGVDVLAASATVPGTGWRVVVTEPLRSVLDPVREIAWQTAYVAGVAALLSVVLGSLIGREITVPVLELRDAALAVAEGDFGRRVQGPQGGGELTELAHAFNFMSRRLRLDRDEIAAKNAEIEAFNRELQDRVEERTRQLREAQDQLVRSARLAAVGEMGAGLAHELNNPLTGILGLAQLLLARAPDGPDAELLRSIEEEARRCTRILRQLEDISGGDTEEVPVDPSSRPVVDLAGVVDEVLGLVRVSFQGRGVSLSSQLPAGLEVRGDRSALGQAFAQLLATLRSAASPGSALEVRGEVRGDRVVVALRLSGERLRVGQDDWMASGMAFWAARRTLAAHGGELIEDPSGGGERGAAEPGGGEQATWLVSLPRA